MSLFVPKMYQKDIFSIDYEKIIKNGYELIIFDLDNTIGKIKDDVCDKETAVFLNNLNKKIKIVIASNSLKNRVLEFCKPLKCDKIYFSLKPTLKSLKIINKKYNISYKKMVIIGDQLLTDVFVGNRKGLLTILVDKKGKSDLQITGFNRKIEKYIKKKHNIKKGEYF